MNQAIVFHIVERHAGPLPQSANASARAITWMFAALSTIEPTIVNREIAKYTESQETWFEQRLRAIEARIHDRLGELSSRPGDTDWLDDVFTGGELLMIRVLRRLNGSGLLDEYPNLAN